MEWQFLRHIVGAQSAHGVSLTLAGPSAPRIKVVRHSLPELNALHEALKRHGQPRNPQNGVKPTLPQQIRMSTPVL